MRLWQIFPVACFVLVVTACAQLPAAPDARLSANAPASLLLGPPVENFVAEGRLSLQQNKRQDHLRFRWQHTEAEDVVLFVSPLGQGLAEIRRDAKTARLTQPNQLPVEASNLPELAQRVFGTTLPLDSLPDWLRGAHPELEGAVDGWHVSVTETTLHPTGTSQQRAQCCVAYHQRRLLRTLLVTRDEVTLKLIVDSWELPDE
ncbi:MAG: outer membrane lipoprotein LolB [Rugosibacter sp.]|nr:outer membrane lipoprotein LolB [Rugosibacter sp.]